MEYIYLVREEIFLRNDIHVYKVGKGNGEVLDIVNKFAKGTELILLISVYDNYIYEKIMQNMNFSFLNKKEYGDNYFQGSIIAMKKLILEIILYSDMKKSDQYKDQKIKKHLSVFLKTLFDIDSVKIDNQLFQRLVDQTIKLILEDIKHDDTLSRDNLYEGIEDFFKSLDTNKTLQNIISDYYTDEKIDQLYIEQETIKFQNRIVPKKKSGKLP